MKVMVSVDTKLVSLLGYPLKQTFAPRMFNETFRKLRMGERNGHGHPRGFVYDPQGNYPWHQYETITPGMFMPIEMQLGDELGV